MIQISTRRVNRHWKAVLIPCVLAAFAASAGAQTSSADIQEQVRLLRAEIAELRGEVNSLRQELRQQAVSIRKVNDARPQLERYSGPPAAANPPSNSAAPQTTAVAASPSTQTEQQANLDATVSVLQSEVGQLAQTKVESSSKWPVRIYGTILSSTFFNTHDVDWADIPISVNAPSNVFNAGSFSSSLRQSRIGLLVDGPTVGSFKSSGVFAMDFAGGMTDFQATPLFGLAEIVYAYGRLENARTAFEAGQDEMILAPHNPTSLVAYSYPDLYREGNLYLRAPQLRVEQLLTGTQDGGQTKFTLGLVAPIGTYPTFDYPGGTLTNGWLRPAVQAALHWRSGPPTASDPQKSGIDMGVSGSYGRVDLPLANASGKVATSFSATSWAGAFDFTAQYRHFAFDTEGYWGQNLESFGGGIGQPGKAMGGYFEGKWLATQKLQFNAGLGDDHLMRPDRIAVLLNRNTAIFGNTIFQLTPEIGFSLEYRHMVTRPFDGTIRRNENVNLGIAYSF